MKVIKLSNIYAPIKTIGIFSVSCLLIFVVIWSLWNMGNSNTSAGSATVSAGSGTVGKAAATSDIVLFNMDGCPYCANAVAAIKSSGYGDRLTVIDPDDEQRSELYQITKVSSLPSVWIKGKYVGGCNDGPEPWMGIKKIIAGDKIKDFLE
jgi:glutaredoxin